jgi:hypothetical protein
MQWIPGIITPGQGVASGKNEIDGGIRGTIRAQKRFFRQAGIDTDSLYDGTINVDISPLEYQPIKSSLTLRNVQWHPTWAPETFSLFACRLEFRGWTYDGFLYYPHPETKPVRFPGHHIAEIWTKYVDGVAYGHQVRLGILTDLLILHGASSNSF